MDVLVDNFFNLAVLERTWKLLLLGLGATARLVTTSYILGLALGGLVAWARSSRYPLLQWISKQYVDFVRAFPPLVTLVLVFFLSPAITGFSLNSFQAAAFTFSMTQAGYMSEIYRGGFAAVHPGQNEAATALGLRMRYTMTYVIAPQVFRVILPPLTNQVTQVVRDTTLAFFIGYPELVTRAREAASLSANSTPYIGASCLFIAVLVPLQLLSRFLELRQQATVAE